MSADDHTTTTPRTRRSHQRRSPAQPERCSRTAPERRPEQGVEGHAVLLPPPVWGPGSATTDSSYLDSCIRVFRRGSERSPLTHPRDGYVAGMTMVAVESGSFRMGSIRRPYQLAALRPEYEFPAHSSYSTTTSSCTHGRATRTGPSRSDAVICVACGSSLPRNWDFQRVFANRRGYTSHSCLRTNHMERMNST